MPSAPSQESHWSQCPCRRYTFRFEKGPECVGMATGATIHTANGLKVTVKRRQTQGAAAQQSPALAEASV